MVSLRKYTFDVDFDSPAPRGQRTLGAGLAQVVNAEPPPPAEPEPEPEPPAPTFSEEELEAARVAAYQAGRQSVLNESAAMAVKALTEAMDKVAQGLGLLQPSINRASNEISEVAAQVALEVCRKMLPHTADHFAVAEIEAMVAGLMPQLVDHPRLIVRVNPRLAKDLSSRLTAVCKNHGFEGRFQIIEQPHLGAADTQVDWGDGGAERNTRRLWDAVDTLVARTLPHFSRGDAAGDDDFAFEDALNEELNPPPSHAGDHTEDTDALKELLNG